MNCVRFSLVLLMMLLPWYFPTVCNALTFGVVPQQSARKLAGKWGPICAYWSRQSGIEIRFATAPDIPEFERRLARGVYDIAYMNPYHYVVFSKNPGYLAVAKQKGKRITGIIVVRKEASFRNCRDLAGRTLVFPSPAAFAASILTRAHFRDSGVDIVPKYVKSHDSVYRNVSQGFFDAGGGVVRTLMNMDPAIRNNLKILWKTRSYTPHAIAAHPRVPQEVRRKFLTALLMMQEDDNAGPLLGEINFSGFTAANDRDWDDVRALKIDALTALAGE